jgi:enterochelin esterase family protein
MLITILILATNVYSQKYQFTEDSLPQEGVPKGTVEEYTLEESSIYPGSTHHYWTYIPAQYDETKPACVMVFLDGADFVHLKGEMRIPTVFDNLIHKGEMPVTIGIFVNPGRRGPENSMRDEEYLPINDTFARFLLEDLIAEVGKDYNLVDDAAGRAVCGMSDGGVGTFTVVWHRPDAFSKAITHIASYVRIPGGAEYPFLVRQTRENPKPIRVFIQASENDLNIYQGNWTLGNIQMESAKGAGDPPDLDALTGQWDVETNVLGHVSKSVLTITEQGGTLSATLVDENAGELEVTAISYKDGILIYEYEPPKSESKEKESKEKEGWWESNLATWLQVDGDTLKGAMCPAEKSEIDFSVKGRKRDDTP